MSLAPSLHMIGLFTIEVEAGRLGVAVKIPTVLLVWVFLF